MKRYVLLCAIGIHFGIILWTNLAGTVYMLHKSKSSAAGNLPLPPSLTSLQANGLLSLYAKLSGSEIAFGFFAPNVGSQYITSFTLYNNADKEIATLVGPQLYQAESLNRYSSFTRVFEAFAKGREADELVANYAKALVHNMSYRLAGNYPAARRVDIRIFLYHSPERGPFKGTPQYILLYEKQLELN